MQLHSVGTAVTLASRAQQLYPDNDAGALGYVTAAWEPVATVYTELAATVRLVAKNTRRSLALAPLTGVFRSRGHRWGFPVRKVARVRRRDSALPLAARSRHLADVAHAELRLGHTQAAESALLTMERAAPEWSAHHRLPRVLVGELLTRQRPSLRLRELAQRLHVTPGITTVAHHDE